MKPAATYDRLKGLQATTKRLQRLRVPARFLLPRLLGLGMATAGVWATTDYVRALAEERTHTGTVVTDAASARRLLTQTLNEFMGDLSMAARAPLLSATDQGRLDLAARYFDVKLQENPLVSQLAYFDVEGREQLRVSRVGVGGRVQVASAQELQAFRDDNHLSLPLGLGPRQVHASPLELRVQRGGILRPWQPTIRLTTRAALSPPEPAGMLTASFDATAMLARFGELTDGADPGRRMLINGAGYWLAGQPDRALWGFMFGRDSASTLDAENRALWNMLKHRPNGTLVTPGAIYGFATLRLSDMLDRQHAEPKQIISDETWHVISVRERRPWLGWSGELSGSAGVLSLLVLVIGWLWSRTVADHALAEKEAAQVKGELERSERLASLGGLVAGVAHELNTPIGNAVTLASSLSGDAQRTRDEIRAGLLKKSSIVKLVESTTTGSGFLLRNLERASELLNNFKSVAVDQSSEQRRPFHLDGYLEDLVMTLQPQFKHTAVRLVLQANSEMEIDSYPGPLGQVIINLTTNALIHGFQTKTHGTVWVRCTAADDHTATLTVEDDGDGIQSAHLDRIFVPFFSTRIGLGGSGLGLSIAKNIVDSLIGGTLEVSTKEGEFTRFVIRLPDVAPDVDSSRKDHHHVERATA